MAKGDSSRTRRLRARMREEERVTPLELFFDLVFVLALTQCTGFMADHPTWEGVGQAMILLGLLWWSWAGYTWLASVIDPEEGEVRIAFFAAMGGFLIAALCIPEAFGDLDLGFAAAYTSVRAAHIALFILASRDDKSLRKSVLALCASTAVGCGLLVAGSFVDAGPQTAIWGLALILDISGPFFFGTAGWKLMPEHFAERHALVLIIALGESIVAIGVGAGAGLTLPQVGAAVLGMSLVAALWWMYFDVIALISSRRLAEAKTGTEQNAMARDSFSYLHLPMVAGIVLAAVALKKTLGNVDDPLKTVPTFTLLGGVAIYLLAHVAFRFRNVGTINRQRLIAGLALLALVPLATEVAAIAVLAGVNIVLWAIITYETISYGETRHRVRHGDHVPAP